ncbi:MULTISPECIES: DUF1593 domain-containing protein [unclassified Sphingobium]|uniref:DUF1593 domain-containing protein n=1 Tax=unclassified Sphingobium TaxID=2611147 RepID=UPI000D15F455|nr:MULTISPECIES: DUF1593 domain-containing protein [unclassified Sphingobium]MBG6117389.1 hypothetical protein [Sphingobium sp. JAI105]PSO09603.1 hypothetical protein C7E20_21675 [Sphingobium sp. AEW4]TWC96690.1 uncharacterized protein DUF1593 [Sphingobium sp. AEW010]TWD16446.1 uncharacterized protein DUF1593 [Sphingobium sp. AEW013]TWD19770.1 uncharacterized protein DUF1593 [Sphingobium sp. AEW001]
MGKGLTAGIIVGAALAMGLPATANGSAVPAATSSSIAKPRVIVLTDIGNEPDDSESLVRFLLYTDQLDVEGLIATTSTWQKDRVQPQMIRDRLTGYAAVLPKLRKHSAGFPSAKALEDVVRSGRAAYGMSGVGDGKDSEASRLIINAVDKADARPVWISVWGGAVDLAQALWTVRATRTSAQLDAFVAKLRVYSISDQDDAGPWVRRTFPSLFWIVSIHGWNEYSLAAWNGISGDLMRPELGWPSPELVSNVWLKEHIRRGPLGALYPPHSFIMEGDTPAFLYLLSNGLGDTEHPEYGSWGGRYARSDLAAGHFGDVADRYAMADGRSWRSAPATVFRWREAMQNDFAARIGWTLSADRRAANHPPVAILNGVAGIAPVALHVRSGQTVDVSAQGSSDPDEDGLSYRWWHYAEPSGVLGLKPVPINASENPVASFVAPKVDKPTTLHIILEIRDRGSPPLTRYRRLLVTVDPA